MSLDADPSAVAALVAGDPAGLEAIYRRYADRLYAYARSLLRDDESASDVVQETFVIAHDRVGQLRDPARLASWLYTIVRNECLARLRARRRTVLFVQAHEPILDTDPGRAVHAAQVRELVHAAAAGMNEPDREVFELTVRHGMSAADIARVLEISEKHAHARISRVRDQFEGSLGALLLARDARGQCDELDAIVDGWDGELTALLRKRIDRHVRDCATCDARRRERMDPAGLLAAYAALPLLAVPAQVWHRVQLASGAAPAASAAPPAGDIPTVPLQSDIPASDGVTAQPTMPLHPGSGSAAAHGSPSPGLREGPAARKGPSNRRLVLGAVAAVLLIIGGTSAAALLTLDRTAPSGPVAQPTTPAATTAPAGTPSPTPAPTTPSATAPSPTPPAPFGVTADGEWVCGSPPIPFTVTVQANRTLAQVTLFWRAPAGPGASHSQPMEVSGKTAELTIVPGSAVPDIQWWVVATTAGGPTVTSTPVVTDQDC